MSEQRQEMTDETTDERENEGSTEERDAGKPEATSSSAASQGSEAAADDVGAERTPLLADDNAQGFRRRWDDLQAGFVDHPREVVEEADDLVGKLMQEISTGFDERRSSLEAQWERGDDVSTEDLRIALTRYRSFFNRLLSA